MPTEARTELADITVRERPDLDATAKHLTGRLIRLAALFQAAYARAFAPLGLNDGD